MLLPVIRAYQGDEHQVVSNLEACLKLDGKLDATAIISHDSAFDPREVVKAAEQVFKTVATIETPVWHGSRQWPQPQNWAWQTTAKKIHSLHEQLNFSGWLWWEADACPIREGWLTALSKAHEIKPKMAFSGFQAGDALTPFYSPGGATIYPLNIVDLLANSGALYDVQTVFDRAAGPFVRSGFKNLSHLILHHFKSWGGSPGRNFSTKEFNHLLRQHPQAVFFHGADASLAEIVAGKRIDDHSVNVPPPVVSPECQYSISIICFNNLDLTKRCIQSVLKHSGDNYELIITDNGSTDGTAKYLSGLAGRIGPKLRVVTNAKNNGFIAPNNHALELAKGRYLVLLNNDMEVCAGWLRELEKPFHHNPLLAITGIKNTCTALTNQFEGCPSSLNPDYIEGSCLMIPTALARQHGLFSKYLNFAYCEDSDLSLRLREAGYAIQTVNLPISHHHRGATSKLVQLDAIRASNRATMEQRWGFYIRNRTFERKVLIRRGGAHGDVLFLTPVLDAMKKKWPYSRLTVATHCPEVVPSSLANTAPFNISAEQFDTCYDLDWVYERTPTVHAVKAYADACGLECEMRLVFESSSTDKEWAKDVLGSKPTVVLHCGPTHWPGRDWPTEKFNELSRHLIKEGWQVAVVGKAGNYVPAGSLNLTGRSNASKLHAVLESSALFIGIDSLPFNLAQAADIPAVGLFGTINPKYRLMGRPWQIGVHADTKKVACVFEHHRLPPPVTHSTCGGDCMAAITVEQVIAAIPRAINAKLKA